MTKEIPIGSPIRTKAIINQYFVKAQKSLGQNFLVDLEAIMGIIKAAQIVPGDQVVEIGPGIGSLTEQLLLAGSKVFAYEVDERFVEILDNELPKRVNGKERDELFKLKMQDVLKADFRSDLGGFFDLTKPVKVVANLPYYITTPIIFYLHKSVLEFSSLTLMMQKEVAQRLSAKPKNKNYGPLSLAIQRQMEVKLALNVERTCFIPRPHVDSSVVVLKPLENKPDVGDTQHFDWVVKLCFSQRRKTLNNNLKNLIPETEKRQMILAKLGLKPQVRPEELTLEQFGRLAQYIPKNK